MFLSQASAQKTKQATDVVSAAIATTAFNLKVGDIVLVTLKDGTQYMAKWEGTTISSDKAMFSVTRAGVTNATWSYSITDFKSLDKVVAGAKMTIDGASYTFKSLELNNGMSTDYIIVTNAKGKEISLDAGQEHMGYMEVAAAASTKGQTVSEGIATTVANLKHGDIVLYKLKDGSLYAGEWLSTTSQENDKPTVAIDVAGLRDIFTNYNLSAFASLEKLVPGDKLTIDGAKYTFQSLEFNLFTADYLVVKTTSGKQKKIDASKDMLGDVKTGWEGEEEQVKEKAIMPKKGALFASEVDQGALLAAAKQCAKDSSITLDTKLFSAKVLKFWKTMQKAGSQVTVDSYIIKNEKNDDGKQQLNVYTVKPKPEVPVIPPIHLDTTRPGETLSPYRKWK